MIFTTACDPQPSSPLTVAVEPCMIDLLKLPLERSCNNDHDYRSHHLDHDPRLHLDLNHLDHHQHHLVHDPHLDHLDHHLDTLQLPPRLPALLLLRLFLLLSAGSVFWNGKLLFKMP